MRVGASASLLFTLGSLLAACGGSNDGGVGHVATYTVSYSGNSSTGGSVPVDANAYAEGQTITVLGNTGGLTRTGFTFGGWNTRADGTGTAYFPGQTFSMGTANVVLHAAWTPLPTFSVTYAGNGSTGGSVPVDANAYVQGQAVAVLGNTGGLARDGFTFRGWNTQADGSGATVAPGQTFSMGAANVVLHAAWKVNLPDAFAIVVAAKPETGWEPTLLRNGTLTPIKDINPGPAGSSARWFADLGSEIYFTADDGSNGWQIWSTDLTASGTVKATQLAPSDSIAHLHACNGKIFFLRRASPGDPYRLWVHDPISGRSEAIRESELNLDVAVSRSKRACLNDAFYLVATSSANGDEIWKSDGTTAGTVILKDIEAGISSSSPDDLTVLGGKLLFSAYGAAFGRELWSADGTSGNTAMVADYMPGSAGSSPRGLTPFGGRLLFAADTPGGLGTELNTSDGSAMSLALDVVAGAASGVAGLPMFDVGGTLMFLGYSGPGYNTLYQWDGTNPRPGLRGFWPGPGTGPARMIASRRKLFLSTRSIEADMNLVMLDPGGAVEFLLGPGSDPYLIELTARDSGNAFVKGDLGTTYFVARTTDTGYELWSTDGTAAGTSTVTDYNEGDGDGVRRN